MTFWPQAYVFQTVLPGLCKPAQTTVGVLLYACSSQGKQYFQVFELLGFCPGQAQALVQVAFQQADYAAWNIWAAIHNRALLPFRYQHLGDMMSLGKARPAAAVLPPYKLSLCPL